MLLPEVLLSSEIKTKTYFEVQDDSKGLGFRGLTNLSL